MTAFLSTAEETETEYGVADCSLFPADWIKVLTGIDPAQTWRGRYSDEEGAFAFVRECGGLIPTFATAAALAGLRVTRQPKAGAVGVVHHPGVRGRAVGAICLGAGLWVARAASGGLWFARPRVLKAWEVRT